LRFFQIGHEKNINIHSFAFRKTRRMLKILDFWDFILGFATILNYIMEENEEVTNLFVGSYKSPS
jgi:hypothetical protein